MKRKLLSVSFLLLSIVSYAQKWETHVKLSSGIFRFVGEGANNNADPFNAYGTKSGFSYGIGIDFQRLNTHFIRYGLSIDLESLQSKAPFSYNDLNNLSWEGRTLLRHNFLTLYPYLSCNWKLNAFTMNLKSGIEFAFRMGPARENYKATSENGEIESYKEDRSSVGFDFRPSVQIGAYKNAFGLGIGYAYGIVDYKLGWVGGTNLVFSRYLRISLQYQLLNKKPKQ